MARLRMELRRPDKARWRFIDPASFRGFERHMRAKLRRLRLEHAEARARHGPGSRGAWPATRAYTRHLSKMIGYGMR